MYNLMGSILYFQIYLAPRVVNKIEKLNDENFEVLSAERNEINEFLKSIVVQNKKNVRGISSISFILNGERKDFTEKDVKKALKEIKKVLNHYLDVISKEANKYEPVNELYKDLKLLKQATDDIESYV